MRAALILALAAVVAGRPDGQFYDEKYENFDVDGFVKNPRLMKSYAHCYLEKGKCTPEGKDFKKWIPETIQSSCGKCSEKQKTLVAKVIKANMETLPEVWDELNQKYNPDGSYTNALNEFLQKYAP